MGAIEAYTLEDSFAPRLIPNIAMTWLGNVRYPPETMQDLSDAEWIELLRERYGERICFCEPQVGGNPHRTVAEWKARGMIGVYLKLKAVIVPEAIWSQKARLLWG
jgi:hypothetical protein